MLKLSPGSRGFFVTGSDTGVGKTWISCQLIQQLKKSVPSLKVRKPVESGCARQPDNQLLPADGMQLFSANDCRESLQLVTPYRFEAALAPDLAARREHQQILLDQLEQAVNLEVNREDFLLVEGAGGFYSPIAQDGLNADLARRLKLDVIIVTEDRLGAINQSLLTIRAVESERLNISMLILNQNRAGDSVATDNLSALREKITYPVYSCAFMGSLPPLALAELSL
ncbi:MAG: dethiobiotin synthase [Gammaproteobacteria bacterium]|nr:dethiobiotin synthase [Gammaproteobacteria bacterium]